VLDLIRWLVFAFAMYLIPGIIFGVAFAARGVHQMDASASGAGWGFRALIVPGSALFWPLLLTRWTAGRRAREVPPTELPTDDGLGAAAGDTEATAATGVTTAVTLEDSTVTVPRHAGDAR